MLTLQPTTYFVRDASAFVHNGPYSIMGWTRNANLAGTRSVVTVKNNANQTEQQGQDSMFFTTTGAVTLRVHADAGTQISEASTAAGVVSAGVEYHVALVRESATVLRGYINGSLVVTNTGDISGRTLNANRIILGRRGDDAGQFAGDLGYYKVWQGTALNAAQVATESQYRNAQVANPWAVWRMQDVAGATTDTSSNGRTLTRIGSAPTDAADPAGILGDGPASSARFRLYLTTG